MRAVDIIARKRDGLALSRAEIEWFVDGYLRGDVADYQAAAWLMAICCRGMSGQETTDLTEVMVASGQRLDLSHIGRPVADKHSTGGVGDKTTLVVVPLAAACGLAVAKMSGRGLGFTGGTIDKLESINGFQTELSAQRFLEQIERIGLAIAGQSAELAPADGRLYALRDVTGTVESIPLIASSIMSKKIAAGSPAICLDVKAGRGAFMKDLPSARELARSMVEIGWRLNRRVTAVVTRMDEPLGQAIGNALEVREAIATLRGRGPADLTELAVTLTAEMLRLAGASPDEATAVAQADQTLRSGAGLAKLAEMVAAQDGDPEQIHQPDLLPQAPIAAELPSPRSGYVASVDPAALSRIAVELGAGRVKKADPIDHSVGLVVQAKVGDLVREGEPLAVVHCRDRAQLEELGDRLLAAFSWSELPVSRPPLVLEVLREPPR